MAARLLVERGHEVTLHARNDARAADARRALPQANAILVGDLASLAETRRLADQVNKAGRYDAVIHNAGVGYQERYGKTIDGLSHVFQINVLAPYLLTALVTPPERLIYLSSGMHMGGRAQIDDLQWTGVRGTARKPIRTASCSTSCWPSRWRGCGAAYWSNALEPGWVATKMGGPGAPDDLSLGAVTQAWLAVSDEPAATISGQYFYHQQPRRVHAAARRAELQADLLGHCAELTGAPFPGARDRGKSI